MSGISRTLGVDLAAQPGGRAVCQIEWSPDGGRILPREDVRLSDKCLAELIADPDVSHVGIDAPFGWPSAFAEAVSEYQRTATWTSPDERDLRFRETDLRIKDVTGRDPLSVTAGYLVYLAWHCAEILSGVPGWDRSARRGKGRLVEVYPAASLSQWGLNPKDWTDDSGSYKRSSSGGPARCRKLAASIQEAADDRLDFGGDEERFASSDDELDALVAALTVRAVSLGLGEPLPDDVDDETILSEGWIRLPAGSSSLADIFA